MTSLSTTPARDALVHASCKALYCLHVAQSIDMVQVASLVQRSEKASFRHKGRAHLGESGATILRLSWAASPPRATRKLPIEPVVEVSIYEFGALCVTWTSDFVGELAGLVELSSQLSDNAELTQASQEVARGVMHVLAPALVGAQLAGEIEDYIVFELAGPPPGGSPLAKPDRGDLARILRAEPGRLSEQETEDALSQSLSYGAEDTALVDWLAAVLIGHDTEGERRILELATVELLERRVLDARLRVAVEEAYRLLARPRRPWDGLALRQRELEQVARIQADEAQLYERIESALELWGDDYLSRVYRRASERFRIGGWKAASERKLGVLRTVHQSFADIAGHRRSEALEWIIIVLIAVDIALYFTPLR